MRSLPLLVALAVTGVTGCAAVTFGRGIQPRTQLAQGALALEKQNYGRARELLEPVYYQYWEEPEGQQALLMLIAAELDGRNPDRRLWAAADMATRLLQIPTLQAWMVPIVESYYTVADELGATEERVAHAESRSAQAEGRATRAEQAAGTGRATPTTTRESVGSQVRRAQRETEAQRARVKELEAQNAALDKEVRETKQELERIKKTIKP